MLNFFLLYKYTITNFEKSSIVLVIFCCDGGSVSGLDTRANRTRRIVHACDLQHACCFAHEKDCEYTVMFTYQASLIIDK